MLNNLCQTVQVKLLITMCFNKFVNQRCGAILKEFVHVFTVAVRFVLLKPLLQYMVIVCSLWTCNIYF
jgi:hypothetical protein